MHGAGQGAVHTLLVLEKKKVLRRRNGLLNRLLLKVGEGSAPCGGYPIPGGDGD